MIEFRMPSLGADMEAGKLVEWLVKPGDVVKRGDVIALVDTQKGLFDIEVFDEGIIEQLTIKEQEKVPVGTVMALIKSPREATATEPSIPAPVITEKEAAPILQTAETTLAEVHQEIKASPLAKRMARENGIDLSTIKGTGESGAITKEDVERAIMEEAPAAKEKTGASTESIRMAVAAAMSRSNREIPHYYLAIKIDMSKALAWLAEINKQQTAKERLLPVVLFIKAVAKALAETPQLNAYWENGLQLKDAINIGFVISLRTGGLVIPAIQDADKKSLQEIMQWLNDVIPRTRALKLRSSDVLNATITISSLAEEGAEAVYGVIYPPQVALVGFGSIIQQPWAENGMLGVRPVVSATLAADHRATDGQAGSRFLVTIKNLLQKPEVL
jgi:pyruvate dehydrogenase E2 component (dihydrolipoamide acetyltransferase)